MKAKELAEELLKYPDYEVNVSALQNSSDGYSFWDIRDITGIYGVCPAGKTIELSTEEDNMYRYNSTQRPTVPGSARYVFIFKYDTDWMISLFKDSECCQHFSSAEQDLDPSLDYVDLFIENGGNLYDYEVPDYDYVENIDVFNLKDEPILALEEWRINR